MSHTHTRLCPQQVARRLIEQRRSARAEEGGEDSHLGDAGTALGLATAHQHHWGRFRENALRMAVSIKSRKPPPVQWTFIPVT